MDLGVFEASLHQQATEIARALSRYFHWGQIITLHNLVFFISFPDCAMISYITE